MVGFVKYDKEDEVDPLIIDEPFRITATPERFIPGAGADDISLAPGQRVLFDERGAFLSGEGVTERGVGPQLAPTSRNGGSTPATRARAQQITQEAVEAVNRGFGAPSGPVADEFQDPDYGPTAMGLARPPQRGGPPSVYDPSPEELTRYQQSQMVSPKPIPGPHVEGAGRSDLLEAIREQRQGDAVAQILNSLAGVATGGMAQGSVPGSTALQDYMTQRDAAVQDRTRALQEFRQSQEDRRGQQIHDARMRQLEAQFAASEADADLQRRLRDPESQESQRAREAYQAIGQELEIQDMDALIEGQSAQALRENPEFQRILDYATEKGIIGERGQFTRYGRSTARGFASGTGQRRESQLGAIVSDLVRSGAYEDEESARAAVQSMSPRNRGLLQRQLMNTLVGARTGSQKEERREEEEERQHRVGFGYARREGAPELTTAERQTARDLPITTRNVGSAIRQLAQIAREASALEAGQARAGFLNERMADARALQEEVVNALREIGNYGVPQEAEIRRMEGIAPRIDSFQGLMSAYQQYMALWRMLNRSADTRMRGLGYERTRGGSE